MDMYLLWERSKGVIMAKKQLKPCEPPSSQKKHRNWRRCRWQFNTICCAYVDESAMDNGFALYRDRDDISNEECKNRFLPIDNKLANGEEDYCRCAGVFVEMKSSTEVKRLEGKALARLMDTLRAFLRMMSLRLQWFRGQKVDNTTEIV